jgi:hypothetical protein
VPSALKLTNSAFCNYDFRMILSEKETVSLNSINRLIFVMVKYCVFFEVRTEFLNRPNDLRRPRVKYIC